MSENNVMKNSKSYYKYAEEHYSSACVNAENEDTAVLGVKEYARAMLDYLVSIVEDSDEFSPEEKVRDIVEIKREMAGKVVNLDYILAVVGTRLNKRIPSSSEKIMAAATDIYNTVCGSADVEIEEGWVLAMKAAALSANVLRQSISRRVS